MVRRLILAATLLAAQPSVAWSQATMATSGRWDAPIAEASRRFGVPELWIRAIIRAESGGIAWRDGRPLTSRAGAIGLMQVMPATYAAMARANGLGADPSDPRDNILAGTAFLRAMYDAYGSPGFLAAYNAGPGRYEAYRDAGRPLPLETRAYVAVLAARLGFESDGAAISLKVPVPDTLFATARTLSDRLFFPVGAVARPKESDGQ